MEVLLDARRGNVEPAFAAAYQFLARAFVRLTRQEDGRIRVGLRPRPGGGPVPAAAEFVAEVEEQRLRLELARRNTRRLEDIVARALFAEQPSTPSEVTAIADSMEQLDLDDIATTWEERQLAAAAGTLSREAEGEKPK